MAKGLPFMNLYHFTSREHLPSILREGLSRGDVPLTPTTGLNAVWLTSDASPDGHGLSSGEVIAADVAARAGVSTGGKGFRTHDKRAVRLLVNIPRGDRRLVRWRPWARKNIELNWLAALENAGGGSAKARTWFLFWGVIPPTWIREKVLLGASTSQQEAA